MKRQEALEHYKENVANDLVKECSEKVYENLNNNEEKIKKLMLDGVRSLETKGREIKENIDSNYQIRVLQFELLRTNILNETFKIFVHGYDFLWYLDENAPYEEIDLLVLFKPFLELREKLIKAKKIYIGKINNYDIQQIIFDGVLKSFKKMSLNMRIWFWNFDEIDFIKESTIFNTYDIRFGEYQGNSEIIFKMDNREKTSKDVLKLKKESKEKLPFVYSVWKNSKLDNLSLCEEKLIFINFKGSYLENINFDKSELIKSQFKNTKINQCKLENVNLLGACFQNSNIKNTSFKNSNLTNLDFRNATFKSVSFENAIVKGAVFPEKQVPFLHLTPEQLQDIYIERGK